MFFSEILFSSDSAHGRIINFFIFWRRNARSHTKYPIPDKIIGTSVLAVRVGWLRGFGAALGLGAKAKGLGLAGVEIAGGLGVGVRLARGWDHSGQL